LLGQEKKWATKKTWAARRKAATSTTRSPSKSSRAGSGALAAGNVHRAEQRSWDCILVWELVDNSVDEAMAGYADDIKVTVHTETR